MLHNLFEQTPDDLRHQWSFGLVFMPSVHKSLCVKKSMSTPFLLLDVIWPQTGQFTGQAIWRWLYVCYLVSLNQLSSHHSPRRLLHSSSIHNIVIVCYDWRLVCTKDITGLSLISWCVISTPGWEAWSITNHYLNFFFFYREYLYFVIKVFDVR